MAGALPFLATARETMLISIGSHGESSAPNALDYLAWHDVRARRIHLPASSGIGPGRQLIAAASGEGADLLAMGAYGHLPGREFLFGGATREVLAAARLPLLLTH
jgi:nucleotide-binding universal stress UspA family protein